MASETPIRRGTAKRLGLERPAQPQPVSWDEVRASLVRITAAVQDAAARRDARVAGPLPPAVD